MDETSEENTENSLQKARNRKCKKKKIIEELLENRMKKDHAYLNVKWLERETIGRNFTWKISRIDERLFSHLRNDQLCL